MGVVIAATLPPLLERRGWTQEQLADACGIRRTDINAMLSLTRKKGPLKVGPKRLQMIADALEVSVLELGAPAAETDAKGQSFLDLLAALRDEHAEQIRKLRRDLNRAATRIRALEQRFPDEGQQVVQSQGGS